MTIHWWRTERLVEELARDGVSESQSLWYAAISTVIYYEAIYYAVWYGGHPSWLLLAEFLAICIVAVVGLQECFKANGGSQGSHFLKRLYCLGAPIGLKIAIVSTVFGQLMYFCFPLVVTTTSFRNPFFVYQLACFFVSGMFAFIYFWLIAYHMGRIAKGERSNSLMQPTGRERPVAD